MSRPFVGPSYTLTTRKAAIDRAVNLYPVAMEAAEKAAWILDSIPGLTVFSTPTGVCRGDLEVGSRAFAVYDSTLYEITSDGAATSRGTLLTSTGQVSMAFGLSQLVLVDGSYGYVLTLATNVLARITDPAFYGSATVRNLDGYFAFIRPGTQQFYIPLAVDNATTFDALDFASSESAPDNLVAQAVVHQQLLLMGTYSTEFYVNTGASDFPIERTRGQMLEVGCLAPHSVREVDNSVVWIGRDKYGSINVYRLNGAIAQIVSTVAVAQALLASTDLSAAVAYIDVEKGKTFWCVNAPGLTSTWCVDVSNNQWHERCDLDADGQFTAHRVTHTMYAFGKRLVGAADGKLYYFDRTVYTNNGDVLVRERTSPHDAVPGRVWQFFSRFFLDCTTGEAPQGVDPQVELSYSNDSGASWSDPILRAIGKVGERFARVLWTRLGRSRDRVWKVRFSGNAPFSILDGGADVTQGMN